MVLHVRPRGSNLDYDWIKMQNDLIEEDILKKSKDFRNLYFCSSKDIYSFFRQKLNKDIFYMLNIYSKKKILVSFLGEHTQSISYKSSH